MNGTCIFRERIIFRNLFINFNIKKAPLCSLFLLIFVSCGTTPPEVKNFVQQNGYAGHWASYKSAFGGNSLYEQDGYLSIRCDGSIKYEIDRPWALIFKKDTDDGSIKSIDEKSLTYKNWMGISWTADISKPEKVENGCMKINFKGTTFTTFYPTDCSKPEKSFNEHLNSFYQHLKSKDYVYCN